jgi:hypothetical protein
MTSPILSSFDNILQQNKLDRKKKYNISDKGKLAREKSKQNEKRKNHCHWTKCKFNLTNKIKDNGELYKRNLNGSTNLWFCGRCKRGFHLACLNRKKIQIFCRDCQKEQILMKQVTFYFIVHKKRLV